MLTPYGEIIVNYCERCLSALARVTTPYVALAGHDDLLVLESAGDAARFLDHNTDYIACHGMYFSFHYLKDGIEIECSTYNEPSLDGAEFGTRLFQLFSRYESPFAAVYRLHVFRTAIEWVRKKPTALFPEIVQAISVLMEGKIKRLDCVYYLRSMGYGPATRPFEGWNQWFLKDFDEFFDYYRTFRATVIEMMCGRIDEHVDLKRMIDLAFMLYMGREFHILYWIPEYLSAAIVDEQERDRVRLMMNERLLGKPPSETLIPADPHSIALEPIPGVRMPATLQARFSNQQWELLSKRLGKSVSQTCR